MQITTRNVRPMPLALGIFFTSITARVLFDDVVTGSGSWLAAITTSHALTAAALVGAISAGHYAVPAFKARAHVAGVGLAILFVAATAYILASSGMRNATAEAAKAARAEAVETQRKAADAKWSAAKADHDAAKAYAKATRAAADAECGTGKGRLCDGKTLTASAAASNETARESHERLMRATLDLIPAAPAAGVGYERLAAMLADIGAGRRDVIAQRLATWLPFAAVVISELATIVFFGLAFPAHALKMPATVSAPALPAPAPTLQAVTVAAPVARLPAQTASVHPVIAALRDANRPLTNDELAAAMGVTKGEASKRRMEVAEHLVMWRQGRCLMAAVR